MHSESTYKTADTNMCALQCELFIITTKMVAHFLMTSVLKVRNKKLIHFLH